MLQLFKETRKETITLIQKSTRFLLLFFRCFFIFSFFTKKNVFLFLFNSYTNPIKSGLKFCVWFLFFFCVSCVVVHFNSNANSIKHIWFLTVSQKLAFFTFESLLQLLLGFLMISALSHKNLRLLERKETFQYTWLETVAIYNKRTSDWSCCALFEGIAERSAVPPSPDAKSSKIPLEACTSSSIPGVNEVARYEDKV